LGVDQCQALQHLLLSVTPLPPLTLSRGGGYMHHMSYEEEDTCISPSHLFPLSLSREEEDTCITCHMRRRIHASLRHTYSPSNSLSPRLPFSFPPLSLSATQMPKGRLSKEHRSTRQPLTSPGGAFLQASLCLLKLINPPPKSSLKESSSSYTTVYWRLLSSPRRQERINRDKIRQ
jgi:hypothetical protein